MSTEISAKCFVKDSEFPKLKAGKLRLYSMRLCPFAQRTRLVLDHKNIQYETVNMDLYSKPEWFLERNPLGKVPVLEMDDQVIYESDVTCDYLDNLYPELKLNPADPYQQALDKMLLERYNQVIINFYASQKGDEFFPEIVEKLQQAMEVLDKALETRGDKPFFGGDKVGMLDYMFWPHLERTTIYENYMKPTISMLSNPNNERFPRLSKWYAKMLEQPSIKKTVLTAEDHMTFYSKYSLGWADCDQGLTE